MPFEPITPSKIYVGNNGKVLAKVKKTEIEEKLKTEFKGGMIFPDMVNRPPHYNQGQIEVSDFIADQKMNFFEGNVVKYLARYKFKNGLEDLKKCQWYLTKLIKLTEGSMNEGEAFRSQKLENK